MMWIALQLFVMIEKKGREMTENEVLDLKLSANLLRLMLDEKIPFEKKKGKIQENQCRKRFLWNYSTKQINKKFRKLILGRFWNHAQNTQKKINQL